VQHANEALAEVEWKGTDPNMRFRPIPGFPNYLVGSNGTLWSRRGRGGGIARNWKRLKGNVSAYGYRRFCLTHESGVQKVCHLHRLVLQAFVGPCPEGMEACHAPDPNKLNCRIENLRWATRAENLADYFDSETFDRALRRRERKLAKRLRANGWTLDRIARRLGVSTTYIHHVCKDTPRWSGMQHATASSG
jgi:hypothetical protein